MYPYVQTYVHANIHINMHACICTEFAVVQYVFTWVNTVCIFYVMSIDSLCPMWLGEKPESDDIPIFQNQYASILLHVSRFVILSLNFKNTDYGIYPIYRGIFLTSLVIYPVFLIERKLSIIVTFLTRQCTHQQYWCTMPQAPETTPIQLKRHKISAQNCRIFGRAANRERF